tara:strand:+ start:86 stop:520 length:435 start_codon:yes stop_codon:yes gene_type:complete
MESKKIYLKGLVLLCLGLALSACDNSKNTDIIVKPIDSPITLKKGQTFLITTLPQGFIITPGLKPTTISYSVSLNGDTDGTCNVVTIDSNGDEKYFKELSGTTYADKDNGFLAVVSCTPKTKVNLHMTYQIGTQKYAGSSSFTA